MSVHCRDAKISFWVVEIWFLHFLALHRNDDAMQAFQRQLTSNKFRTTTIQLDSERTSSLTATTKPISSLNWCLCRMLRRFVASQSFDELLQALLDVTDALWEKQNWKLNKIKKLYRRRISTKGIIFYEYKVQWAIQ